MENVICSFLSEEKEIIKPKFSQHKFEWYFPSFTFERLKQRVRHPMDEGIYNNGAYGYVRFNERVYYIYFRVGKDEEVSIFLRNGKHRVYIPFKEDYEVFKSETEKILLAHKGRRLYEVRH